MLLGVFDKCRGLCHKGSNWKHLVQLVLKPFLSHAALYTTRTKCVHLRSWQKWGVVAGPPWEPQECCLEVRWNKSKLSSAARNLVSKTCYCSPTKCRSHQMGQWPLPRIPLSALLLSAWPCAVMTAKRPVIGIVCIAPSS